MFEWLDKEIDRIKTPKFHLVDGPASTELRRAVEGCDFPLPPSYRDFVLRFGNAKLYRSSSNWLVKVYAGPREAESDSGEPLIHFGRTDMSLAYFKEQSLVEGKESPVFEWRHEQGLRKAADSFEDWLDAACASARKLYNKKEWDAIEKGPSPFTEHERSIVEARKKFRWRVVGVTPNEDLRFEIYNGSRMTLPDLSLGVRGTLRPPDIGPWNGGCFLRTASIQPGETAIVEKGCYKKFIAPENTEVFDLPDPGPEDREQYWEFKA